MRKPLGAQMIPGANLVIIRQESLEKLKLLVLLPAQVDYLRTQYVQTVEDPKRKTKEFVFRETAEVKKLLGMAP